MRWPQLSWPFRRRAPRVAVICSTYRKGGLSSFAHCLQQQTRPPDEVIFACDGLSLDDAVASVSVPVVLPPKWRDTAVILDRPRDAPFAVGMVWNAGIDRALRLLGTDTATSTGSVVMISCDHTWISRYWIERNLELLTTRRPALFADGMVLHRTLPDEEAHSHAATCCCNPMVTPVTPIAPEIALLGGRVKDSGWSAIAIEADLLRKIGGFDERLSGGYGYDERLVSYRAELHSGRPCMISMHPDVVVHRMPHDRGGRSEIRSMSENWKICSAILDDPAELRRPAWRAPVPAPPPLPLEEVDRRGEELARGLKLPAGAQGRIVAIDVTTGAHYVGDSLTDLIVAARARNPRAQTYSFRPGGSGVYRV